jgi:4-hydroxy-3-polyprenylbenzoate decarboxylase
VKIHRLYSRNEPIILASAPFLASTHSVLASKSAALWNELEEHGIAGISAVNHRAWGVTIVAIKQLDAAHVKRVAQALMESSAGRGLRYAIVVDEDIDPFNPEKVFWAIATRYEPQVALEIVRRLSNGEQDLASAKEGDSAANNPGSAAIIDGCRPYRWIDKFPRTTDISEELMKRTVQKWGKVLERKT